MQDHEFEKQVHQKMEEIKILPSDAVWKEVERRLHPKDKSRRWLWFPFLFIALGIGGYLMYIDQPASYQAKQPEADLSLPNRKPLKDNKDKTAHREELLKTTKYKRQDTIEIATLSTANKERYLSEKRKKTVALRQLTLPAPATQSDNLTNKTGKPEINSLSQNHSTNRKTYSDVIENIPVNTQPSHQPASLSSGSSGYKTDGPSGSMNIRKEPVPAHINAIAPSYPVNTSLALRNLLVAVNAPVRKQQKRSGWEWGLSIQAGQSGVINGRFTSLFARETVAEVNNSFTSGNLSVNPSAVYIPPSALKPGPGYSAGVLVKKQLTRRTSFSVGLQYTRFSTSNKVGKQVTDSVVVLRLSNVADQQAVENFFRVGNSGSYVNKYHFIELPVLFETRLIRNRFLPVYWNLGVSFSRLVSSNALHFDGNARIYYTNNSLFNRNQFSFTTGLPVRILPGERFSLKAGPLFQYGLSDLIKKAGSGSRHLLFVGVKADIILCK